MAQSTRQEIIRKFNQAADLCRDDSIAPQQRIEDVQTLMREIKKDLDSITEAEWDAE